MRQELIWAKNLTILFAILIPLGCGGGGGGTPPDPATNVTISGKVDDGTANSPIPDARCRLIDQNGVAYTARSNTNGEYSLVVPPDVEGNIRCYPSGIPNLALSNFMSTRDRQAGDRISGEDVTPARTVVADIIDSENPPVPQARKLELLDLINSGRDPDLTMVVDLSTQLYKSMLKKNVNVDFGGGEGGGGGGGGGGGDGGGVGGGAGDGGDRSPIANARCDFVVGNDLKTGTGLYNAALADFLDDGMINRPDLDAVKDEINQVNQGREAEVIAAFNKIFPSGLGKSYATITDANGAYFLEIPPNLPGFVRCFPPGQEALVLATYVPGRMEDGDLPPQDVNPATTVFSTNIASKLTGDLGRTKQNYLDDIAGLEVFIREKERDGANILFYSLCAPPPGDVVPPSDCSFDNLEERETDARMVAFSATSLFNGFFKNGVNGDYLAALENLTTTGRVNQSDLEAFGMPIEQAAELSDNVTVSAAAALNTGLGPALSRARVGVTVTDGGLIAGADVDIPNPSSTITCDNCPATTDATGQVTLNLSNVPPTATEITVAVSGVSGYETATATTQVVAFATVDLEIKMTPSFTLTVQGAGDGAGTVTNGIGDINCTIDGINERGACSSDFVSGTQVTLTGGPTTGSTFTGWSGGGCSGAGACTVTMDTDNTVTATFSLNSDIDLPQVTITSPTSGSTYNSSSATLSIGGTATDNVGVTQVTWSNDRGGSGTCSGTGSWSASGIALLIGSNVITVTARDAAGNTGTDRLTVNFSNSAPTISGGSSSLVLVNDPSCNLSLPVGSSFTVRFNYTDPNGNGPVNISQAILSIAYDFFPGGVDGSFTNYTWNSSLSGDGFSGTATTRQCYRFGGNSYVDVTMAIEDSQGAISNPLTVRIDKPSGSN